MTSSEGGGTYWWVAPSSPFLAVGAGVASSSLSVLVVVRSCRRSLLSVVRCCPSFAAVRLRSCPSRVVKSFCVAGIAFGDGCRQQWCCRVSWVGVCPVVAGGARGWFSWVLVVVRGSLCPLRVFVAIIRRLSCCVGWLFSFLDAWRVAFMRRYMGATW